MHAFIIQYFVPDFNLYFLSFQLSSLLYGISLNEYITIYVLISLLVEISVASGVLLSYSFALLALVYILCMCEVLAWREYKPSTFL